ncbi:uncharacterized protein WCC33_009730 [Rhinophrynus dorsalis]
MPWFPQHVPMRMITTVMCFMLFLSIGSSRTEDRHREKRLAVLGTTEIPAASIDLSQFNFTDLVNGMLTKALKGANNFFSFLSVTSYSSFAFHKVSILIYNISNLKHVDYHKFPMRYCYCLNNRTNDLADYTALLLDIMGNSTSSLKELFKSTSIVSGCQSNESDCIYFCVMTGRTGRNLSDLWDTTQKSPVVNFTFPGNESSILDLDSILPNLITSAEDMDVIMDVPKELWTLNGATSLHLQESESTGHVMPLTLKPLWISATSPKKHDISLSTSPFNPKDISQKEQGVLSSNLREWTEGPPVKGQSILSTKLSSWQPGVASKDNEVLPTKTHHLKGQYHSSDKVPLFPQNVIKEHSISFSSHKIEEGSSIKLSGWTSAMPLEILERPYTIIPLWTDINPEVYNTGNSQRTSASRVDFSKTQGDLMLGASSLNEKDASLGSLSPLSTMVSTLVKTTAPLHQGISSSVSLTLPTKSIFLDEKGSTIKGLSWSLTSVGKRHGVSTVTYSSSIPAISETLLPQVKPVSIGGHKMSLPAFTQSRCLQARLAVTSPSVILSFYKINPCVMELCRFYHQCLCVSQEPYSGDNSHRHCVQYYSWYLKNATYICEKVKRNAHQRRTVKAQESGAAPALADLADLPIRDFNNFSFDGVFKNIESVTAFLDCLGSHFTWLQTIYTNFPALLNFVSKLKCVTGLCPKDLEDYGCACRYDMEGLPIDATDNCCYQHRKCHEEALELDCIWDPAKISADVSCLTKNLTCEPGDACERRLCGCDKAAIECFVNAHINSSMKGLDIAFCPDPVTAFPETTVKKSEMVIDSNSHGQSISAVHQNMSVDAAYAPTEEGEQMAFQNDVTTFPSTEEIITDVKTAEPGGMGLDAGAFANSDTNPPTPDTFKTKTGFKMVEESTVRAAVSPVTENEPGESLEKGCDRFNFYQLKEDGNVDKELPLLGEMLYCLTGRCPEEFESYGCYCGQGGKGNPTDVLDSCCFSHQCCLEHLKKIGCDPERNVRSEVLCVDRKPSCIGWGICDKLLCACDKAAAECMAAAPFNETAKSLNKNECQDERLVCGSGGVQDTPDRAIGNHSESSSSESEESSEEQTPMRDIVRSGHVHNPRHSGSPAARGGRRPRSAFLGK